MNLSNAIEVAIGLALMYLLLSLLVTAINELIAQYGGIRAKHLQSALKQMLNLKVSAKDADNLKLFDAITNSPTFQIAGAVGKTKFSGGNPMPSYINRDIFVAALREAIPHLDASKPAGDLAMLVAALPEKSRVKSALKAAIGDGMASAQDIEKRVGDWFDGMMERATGAYKRWMSTLSLLIGLLLAVAFNCDTINVADKLAKSPALRAEVVKVAEAMTQRCAGTDGKPALTDAECKNMQKNLEALQVLPIGGERTLSLFSIAGWLITAFAVSLGAPFWFDLLSKIMNVRSSFKKEEKSASSA